MARAGIIRRADKFNSIDETAYRERSCSSINSVLEWLDKQLNRKIITVDLPIDATVAVYDRCLRDVIETPGSPIIAKSKIAEQRSKRGSVAAGDSPVWKRDALYRGELRHARRRVVPGVEADCENLEPIEADDAPCLIHAGNQMLSSRRTDRTA